MSLRNFILLLVWLFSLLGTLGIPHKNVFAQEIAPAKVNRQNNIPAITISDSLPKEFKIDISKDVIITSPEVFELYKKKGIVKIAPHISIDHAKSPFFSPVNEITLMFSIQNSSVQEKLVYFECGKPDLLELTNLDDPAKQIITGGFLGRSNRISVFSPNKYLPIILPPKKVSSFLAYAKFMGTYKENLIPKILSEKSYQINSIHEIDKTRLQLIYHSFIIGGIFIISVFMLAQFALNRNQSYMLYAAYGFSIFLVSEKIMELNCHINLISYFIPKYVFYSHTILQLLASLFYIRFIYKLLEIPKNEKAIYVYRNIIEKLIMIGCVLYCSVFFFKDNSTIISIAYNYGAFVSTLAMLPLLVLLIMLKTKDPAVYLVIAGFSAVVIGVLTVVYINRSGLYTEFNLLAPISIVELGIFIEMIFFGLALGYKTHKQKLEKDNIELQIKETEMAALKAQMNPHFMFNCINSIDAFIQSNDKYNATLYLNKFAKLIRNVLDSSKQNFVTFSKDIETLKIYIELEELRSENKFITKIDINEELMSSDYKVPALIIQPFVENAIIHGLRNKETNDGLLLINISKTNEQIIYSITDNGIGRKASGEINTGKEKSYGMEMSYDRIKLFNKETTPSVTITDLYENEKPTGTHILVQLNFV